MIISTLEVNEHLSRTLGLSPFALNNLGRIVLLTGANGCGKTRFLASIDWLLEQVRLIGYTKLEQGRQRVEQGVRRAGIDLVVQDIQPYTHLGMLQQEEADRKIMLPLSGIFLDFIDDADKQNGLDKYVEFAEFMRRAPEAGHTNATRLSLGYPRSRQDLSRTGLLSAPLSYVSNLAIRYQREVQFQQDAVEGIGVEFSADPDIVDDFVALQDILRRVVQLQLAIAADGGVTLGSLPIDQVSLSSGQMILLRWSAILHSNLLRDQAVPVLIDEPELHLHPDALNRLFDALLEHAPKAQFWVATHSISLISHLTTIEPRCGWYGDQGKFTQVGKNIPEVVTALLGGTGGAESMIDFCSSPERYALASFAVDCLIEPVSVGYKSGDPQLAQISKFIGAVQTLPVRVLDFGAGQARLLDGLASAVQAGAIKLKDLISYHAVEINPTSKAQCEQKVATLYGPAELRVFADTASAVGPLGSAPMDIVILSNVLHEIPPESWLAEVFASNRIGALLRADGFLLIVEDTLLPRGELAHHAGYVILESEALEVLFGVDSAAKAAGLFETIYDPKYGARLQATKISASLLPRVSQQSLLDALAAQNAAALRSIRQLRANPSPPTYLDGRRHAYLAQLVTNTMLAMQALRPPGAN